MVTKMESQNPKRDAAILTVAALLFSLSLVVQYIVEQPFYSRVFGILLATGASVVLFFTTAVGRKFKAYWQDSVVELRKVVWPTKQETMHSTIAVLAMVFVMALVLWSIDAVLVRIVAWIVKQGAV